MNYLSPKVRRGEWTRPEDERLVVLINEHGRSWSVLSRLFNGPSDNDIKNRWYSHVQHEVVYNDGRLVLRPECLSAFPERRKRRRPVMDVKENARRLLVGAAGGASAGSLPLCEDTRVAGEMKRMEIPQMETDFAALFGGEFGFEWSD
jgi:hypothetical protein